jgi:hypothetical protein
VDKNLWRQEKKQRKMKEGKKDRGAWKPPYGGRLTDPHAPLEEE